MNEYISQVKQGKFPVCKSIKQLIERHEKDLEKSKDEDYPYYFSIEESEKVIMFCEQLKHVKGEWRGKKFILEPFQKFIISLLYGWKYKDSNLRRFRKVYFQIGRKNAKTTLAAMFLLYTMVKEEEAEIYSIATTREQAKIIYNIVSSMVHSQSELNKFITVLQHQIKKTNDCYFKHMSSEGKVSDGLSPSFVLVDEFHAHPDDELINTYSDGMGARKEPLMFITTTAGYDLSSPCYEEYQRAKKILSGEYEDNSFLPIIYELDSVKEWDKKENWIKANPLWTDTLKSFLEKEYTEATQKSSKKNGFLTKNCNLFVDNKSSWLTTEIFKRNADKVFDEKTLIGKECFAALDLSSVNDLTAYTLCFPLEDGRFYFKHKCYIPEESINKREKHEHIQFKRWIDKKYVITTPYDFIDHQYLIDDIINDREKYNIKEVAYDKAYSGSVVSALINEGLDLFEFPQGLQQFSQPTKEYETGLMKGSFIDNNPVSLWCATNAVIKPDTNGNYKPLKPLNRNKRIDLVISSIMAFNRANQEAINSGSYSLDLLETIVEKSEEENKENKKIKNVKEKKIEEVSIFDFF